MNPRNGVKVFVTGAAGFIGSQLVDLLLEEGYAVVGFVREEDNLAWLAGKKIRILFGDCTDKNSIHRALEEDTQYVFHLAGIMNTDVPENYYTVNYGGTRNLVEICVEKRLRLKRLVYVSSVAASGPSGRTKSLTEADPCRPVTDYGKSKVMAENFLRENGHRIPYTILRPTLVYGPRNYRTIFSYFKFVSKGLKPLLGDGMTNVIYVKDLARILILVALRKEAVNETYFIGDEHVYSYSEIADTVSSVMGRKTLTVKFPFFLVFMIGAVLESYAKLTRTRPLFDLRRARDLKHRYWMCDTSKLTNFLGSIHYRPFKEAIEETVDWYRKEGWI